MAAIDVVTSKDGDGVSVSPVAALASTPQPASAERRKGACRGACRTLVDWLCAPRYWAFRIVVLAKGIFQVATNVFTSFALYFLEDCTDAGKDGAQQAMSLVGLINLISALSATYPAGKLAARFGSLPLVNLATACIGVLLVASSTASRVYVMYLLQPLNGISGMSYGVVDFMLLINVISDPKGRTRDVAFCNGASKWNGCRRHGHLRLGAGPLCGQLCGGSGR